MIFACAVICLKNFLSSLYKYNYMVYNSRVGNGRFMVDFELKTAFKNPLACKIRILVQCIIISNVVNKVKRLFACPKNFFGLKRLRYDKHFSIC